jgi:hypothetical protein
MPSHVPAILAFAFALASDAALAQCEAVRRPLRIDFTDQRTNPDWFSGAWTATGAVEDAGTTRNTIELDGAPHGAVEKPSSGRIDHFLTSHEGTIHLRGDATITWLEFPNHTASGGFTIVAGTGRYEGLEGGGTVSIAVQLTSFEGFDSRYHVVMKGSYVGSARSCERASSRADDRVR